VWIFVEFPKGFFSSLVNSSRVRVGICNFSRFVEFILITNNWLRFFLLSIFHRFGILLSKDLNFFCSED